MVRRYLSELGKDKKGSVALIFGLAVPMLIGFTGLAIDGTFWLKERNKLQSSADSAAISAAQALNLDGAKANLEGEARKMFVKIYGSALAGKIRLVVQNPPQSGKEQGNKSAVAVIADADQKSFFLKVAGIDTIVVASRAVAKTDGISDACVLGLDPTEDKGFEVTGSADVNLGCAVASNSTTKESMYISGSAKVTATGATAAGGIMVKNNAKLETGTGPQKQNAKPMADPYGPQGRNLQAPTLPTACTSKNLKVQKDTTLSPGRYCGGMDFTGGTAKLQPGVYILDGGMFKANGNASVIGEGVTIVLTGKGSDSAFIEINGGSTISLHAPKSGTPYDGMVFFQDPAANGGKPGQVNTSTINGNADIDLSGAVYLPNQMLRFTGGSASTSKCLQLVALRVQFSGNAGIKGTCPSDSGTSKLSNLSIDLVE